MKHFKDDKGECYIYKKDNKVIIEYALKGIRKMVEIPS